MAGNQLQELLALCIDPMHNTFAHLEHSQVNPLFQGGAMATTTSPTPQVTDFTRDVMGRYICNGLDEARRSADPANPNARPFDVIVIGGGTFGAVLAQHLFFQDKRHSHRTLVLEGGPFLLPEHVQNLPVLGLGSLAPTSIADLRQAGQFGADKPQAEVWGLPWHSSTKFSGLAYCVGGRDR